MHACFKQVVSGLPPLMLYNLNAWIAKQRPRYRREPDKPIGRAFGGSVSPTAVVDFLVSFLPPCG